MLPMSSLRRGDRGGAVTEIRAALAALGMVENPDADLTTGKHVAADMFDQELDQAVRAFQQHRGLLVDGIVGEATYRALKEASYRLGARTLNHQFGAPMYGDDVATLQARLQDLGFYTDLVDGHFGLQTHNALMSYQREYGLYPDGICGPETLRSLYFLGSRVTGGSPHAIREEELVRRSGPAPVRQAHHHRSGPRRRRPRPDHPTARPVRSAKQTSCGTWQVGSRAG